MIDSVLDPIYDIISTFFPADLLSIPFFNFITNLLVYCFCLLIMYIFFVWPIISGFKWIRSKFRGI